MPPILLLPHLPKYIHFFHFKYVTFFLKLILRLQTLPSSEVSWKSVEWEKNSSFQPASMHINRYLVREMIFLVFAILVCYNPSAHLNLLRIRGENFYSFLFFCTTRIFSEMLQNLQIAPRTAYIPSVSYTPHHHRQKPVNFSLYNSSDPTFIIYLFTVLLSLIVHALHEKYCVLFSFAIHKRGSEGKLLHFGYIICTQFRIGKCFDTRENGLQL